MLEPTYPHSSDGWGGDKTTVEYLGTEYAVLAWPEQEWGIPNEFGGIPPPQFTVCEFHGLSLAGGRG